MSINTDIDLSIRNHTGRNINEPQVPIGISGDTSSMVPFQTTGGIIVITQAAYDALPSGETDTLYVISG